MTPKWIIFICLLSCANLLAQDPHYTLFDSQPLLLNPALTGEIEGNYTWQASIQQRNQWFDALKPHFNHTSFSLESSLPICFGNVGRVNFSPGLSFQQQRFISSSVPRLNMQKIGTHGAVRLQLTDHVYASLGMEFELLQRSLTSTDALQFGTQFDGMGGFDVNLQNGETQIPGSGNLTSGMDWDIASGGSIILLSNKLTFRLGGAIHHIRRPVLSLLGNDDEDARMSHRYTAHYRAKIIKSAQDTF